MGYAREIESRLVEVHALREKTALHLLNEHERIVSKGMRTAFTHPASRASMSILINKLEEMPVMPAANLSFSPEEEAELRSELDVQIQKVLGIMAVLINEGDAEIASMNDMLDTIRVMDETFFDFAEDPEAAARKEEALPEEEEAVHCCEKLV